MATIYVDDRPYEVDPGKNLLEECLSKGLDLPYFCWHPALGSVGACRQCAVKQYRDENDQRGRIVMACMTPAMDGARISIKDRDAAQFRAGIIELLMSNHPHDCPVCDEGGECHLQDMTVMTGHNYRGYRFGKRTFRNQELGPFINHEMNRCITCYRCVRFYRDYAGGQDLDAFASHNHVYFGRHEDGALENEFSGNLVEVCPTGVFTDKTLKEHYTRKWDLQTAPSVCAHCSLGCNTIAGERYGELRRILNRYNAEVNGYFLCDRGRFGYGFVNADQRLRRPRVRDGGESRAAEGAEAVERAAALMGRTSRVIGIGSPRASLEANFALRTLVGASSFFSGMAPGDDYLVARMLRALRGSRVRTPSLREVESADAVFILGEDVTQTAPLLALAVRQAVKQAPRREAMKLRIPRWDDAALRGLVQQRKGPLFIATTGATRLDEVATTSVRGAPDEIARLGFAVARALDETAPDVEGLSDGERSLAESIAAALRAAERPVVVSGSGSGSEAIIDAAAQVARALGQERLADLCFAASESNSFGLGLLNAVNTSEAFQRVADGHVDTVVVLENDLYRRAPRAAVDAMLASVHVVALDHTLNETVAGAEVALPAGSFAETEGTLVNNEGRAQRFYQVYVPQEEVRPGWRWLRDVAQAAGRNELATLASPDDLLAGLARAVPVFAPLPENLPSAAFRVNGEKVPRLSPRASGRTAVQANISVHEPKPPADPDSPLAFSMEGYPQEPPSSLITRFWSPGWNSVQSLNKFQSEVGGALTGGDPGIRLLEPGANGDAAYAADIPAPFSRRKDELLVVPLYHIFGSDELSAAAPAVAERAPKPYATLNAADAERLGVEEGGLVEIQLDGAVYRLPAVLTRDMAAGVLGVPMGVGVHGVDVPAWSPCRKV
jgi:NADH-quinone oxidoreductase subunit G